MKKPHLQQCGYVFIKLLRASAEVIDDYVKWNGIGCFIAGSTGGRPVLRDIDWNLVTKTASVNARTVKFLSRKTGSILYQLIKKQ